MVAYSHLLQLNGAARIENTSFTLLDQSLMTKPTTIYRIQSSSANCKESICERSVAFKNLGNSPCISNFICPVLNQNPCADFGIQLKYSDESVKDICIAGKLQQQTLETSESVQAVLWNAANVTYHATCFYWCTDDGHLPNLRPDKNVADDLILQLVTFQQSSQCL